MRLPIISALLTVTLSSSLLPRQSCSNTWTYPYTGRLPPSSFHAFTLPSCTAQLTFTKDHWVGVQWAFEATYADGGRVVYEPLRELGGFGVSDTFYPYLGNNFRTSYPGNSAFTAVHEFSSICRNSLSPVSWRFYTTSGTISCYTTPQVKAVSVASRPTKVSGVSLRRSNDAGDFAISWSPVSGALAYSVIVQYPSGTDEVGNPCFSVRGKRVVGTSASVATTSRRQDVQRRVIVHAVDERGVWSFTGSVKPVVAEW